MALLTPQQTNTTTIFSLNFTLTVVNGEWEEGSL